MKYKEVKVLLAITVLSVGLTMSGCGKKSEVVEPPVQTVETVETTPEPVTMPEETEPVVDGNLDTSLAGTYFIVTEEQNLYKESNQASDVLDTYPIDTEITVSGLYGDTGLFQVVDADGVILGYVDSAFCDTVKGGYIPEDTTESTTEPADTTTTSEGIGLTEEDLGITQEELNEAIQQAQPQIGDNGIIGGWSYGDQSPVTEEPETIIPGSGDYTGGENVVVD